ncbi:GNAT family N-acetyltransferase [Geofilum rubicundum]|uniref:BioF2-like acetyltransferase domain-containing protein n=1 Tax=Geofilum rubicundum JCM 15548 TaxID=1236989 RepID=A0A0E9LTP1_9BACT|nr:GNAT family N-acetyltransferase [Geofilum rubicundum]GAO28496.1 hypothetical protein JCM15548_1601 [Geofilum rubicundum JCM 15548]
MQSFLVEAKEVTAFQWEAGLEDFCYSLFITREWVESMQDGASSPLFIDFISKGEVVGKLSGLIIDGGWMKGKYFHAYASLALKEPNQQLFDACHVALKDLLTKMRLSRIIIGSYDQQHSMRCTSEGFVVTKRYEYLVNPGAEDFRMSKGFKKNVKKAENRGVFLDISDSEASLQKLFQLLELTRKYRLIKYNVRYNPFFLDKMNESSLRKLLKSGMVSFFSVKSDDGTTNSVQLNLVKGDRVYGLLMGSDLVAYEYGIPSYLDFQIILDSARRDIKYYNTGGAPGDKVNEGLDRYKQAMGGQKKWVYGATTNCLVFPYSLLNPLMKLGRRLPQNNVLVDWIKNW